MIRSVSNGEMEIYIAISLQVKQTNQCGGITKREVLHNTHISAKIDLKTYHIKFLSYIHS